MTADEIINIMWSGVASFTMVILICCAILFAAKMGWLPNANRKGGE